MAAAHILCSINEDGNQESPLDKDPQVDFVNQQKNFWRVAVTVHDFILGRYASRRQFWSRFAAWLEMGRAARHPDLKLPLFLRPRSPPLPSAFANAANCALQFPVGRTARACREEKNSPARPIHSRGRIKKLIALPKVDR
jgi:hypothetical protein